MAIENESSPENANQAKKDETPVSAWKSLGEVAAKLQNPSVLFGSGMLLTILLYIRTTTFGFVWDDWAIPNGARLNSWQVLRDIFTHELFSTGEGAAQSVYYRPLSVLWVAVVKLVTSGSPAWYHLFALATNLFVFYLAYVFGRKLLRDDRLAALTAIMFALHPTKVETVAWIGSSGCDALGAIFFFGVVICYLNWRDKNKAIWLVSSVLCFVAALLTKETLVVVVALVPLHYWLTSTQKRALRTVALLSPYVFALGAYIALRKMVLTAPVAATGKIQPHISFEGLWNSPWVCWWYIKKLFFPVGMGVMYDFDSLTRPSLLGFWLPALALAILAVVAYLAVMRRDSTNFKLLSAWFLLTLLPYVAFAPMVRLHDRYLYLPAYAFCALLGYVLVRGPQTGIWGEGTRQAVTVILVLVAALGTWHEANYWRNEVSIWARATQTAPKMASPWLNLATIYSGDLQSTEAVAIVDQGLQQQPNSPWLWQYRGLLLFDRGLVSDARQSFLKVIEITSTYDLRERPDIAYAKTGAEFHLGMMDIREGNYVSAEHRLREAIALKPEIPELHLQLAEVLRKQGRLEEAKQEDRFSQKQRTYGVP